MTDKSAFTDEEWHALSDAPMLVTLALFATGEHGPISMVKEAAAGARVIAQPGEHGPANALIAEIAAAAESKEARHDLKEHRGRSMEETLQRSLTGLAPAAAALKKLSPDEAAQVGTWFVDIATAIAEAAKAVNPAEQSAIEQITALFEAPV